MSIKNKEIGEIFKELEEKHILTPRYTGKAEKTSKTPIEITKELKSSEMFLDSNFSCLEEFFNKLNFL